MYFFQQIKEIYLEIGSKGLNLNFVYFRSPNGVIPKLGSKSAKCYNPKTAKFSNNSTNDASGAIVARLSYDCRTIIGNCFGNKYRAIHEGVF